MAASVKVLRAEAPQLSIADTFSNLKATHAVKAEETTQQNVQAVSILPVDSGIVIDSHMVQRFVKGEDLAFQYRADPDLLGRSMLPSQPGDPNEWKLNYDVFVVCDGHSGIRANEFVHREFLATLHPLMPLALPASFRSNAGASYAVAVRAAVARTLESLNARFCEALEPAGCTCTVVLVTGSLLTVANVGDSDAVLDGFSEWLPMSVPHRVNDNIAERERVEASGSEIAPLSVAMDGPARDGGPGLGPLRIWPGGLCVSRGIGDVDVGECVIARPHVRQVVVPEWGCRLIVSSDGVWDCISTRTVVSTCKGKSCGAAAQAIVNKCVRVKQGALVDDTTCLVIDCRPYNIPTFKGYYPEKEKNNGSIMHSRRGTTNPILPPDTSMDAVADAAGNLPSAPLTRVPTAETSLPRLVSTGGSATAADGCTHGANAAATAKYVPLEQRRKSKSSGFLCCMGASSTADEDFASARSRGGANGADGRMSDSASGADDKGAFDVDSDPTVGNEGSRSHAGLRTAGSIKGGMQMLWRRRANTLPPIVLFADVDTAHEALPLSTVSESTDSDHAHTTTAGGYVAAAAAKAEAAASSGPRDGGAVAAAAPSTDALRASLDMSFEPPADAAARRRDVLWHTVSYDSPEATTRPHPKLAYTLQPQRPHPTTTS